MPRSKHTGGSPALVHEDKWLHSARDRSAAAYIIEYNIRDKQTAHGQYLQLIDRANISEDDKKQLRDAFESWKKSDGAAFWEARSGVDTTTTTEAQGSLAHVSVCTSEDSLVFGSKRPLQISPPSAQYPQQSTDLLAGEQDHLQSPTLMLHNVRRRRISYNNALQAIQRGSQPQPEFFDPSRFTSMSEDITSMGSTPQSNPTPRRSIASNFYLSKSDFPLVAYEYQGVNIGRAFHEYQLESALTVNQLQIKANKKNFAKFLAMNYIWSLEQRFETVPIEVHKQIRNTYAWPVQFMDDEEERFCLSLGKQVSKHERLSPPARMNDEQHRIYVFYEMISLKLPVEYAAYEGQIEDTYAHGVIDALLTEQFPARSRYKLDWANLVTEGSKIRRVHGNKPDGTLKKEGFEVAFMELKAPKDDRSAKAELEDTWNLAHFCRDAINAHLLAKRQIYKAAALQIFGHKMHLYTMHYQNKVYHWNRSAVVHIPVDQQDTARAPRCLELMSALENKEIQRTQASKIQYLIATTHLIDTNNNDDCIRLRSSSSGRPNKHNNTKNKDKD
ncbi:hypothetical protein BGZ74_004490 [Mortierella antarctica]|nr:hypothetical protein BGZ74_004490 [Mortierella antarctica]